jgi:linoleoyl-CoA desaturase
MSPHDSRYWFHRFQHLYVWGLYALLAVNWQLLGDFRVDDQPGVADTRVTRPRDGTSSASGREGSFLYVRVVLPLAPATIACWP